MALMSMQPAFTLDSREAVGSLSKETVLRAAGHILTVASAAAPLVLKVWMDSHCLSVLESVGRSLTESDPILYT